MAANIKQKVVNISQSPQKSSASEHASPCVGLMIYIYLQMISKSNLVNNNHRMIRNLDKKDYGEFIKNRLMLVITRILKSQNSNSFIVIVLMQLISVFPMASVMFVDEPLEPVEANWAFKIFLPSFISTLANVNEKVVLVIILIITIITAISIALNLSKSPLPQIITILSHLTLIIKILSVPVLHYTIQNVIACIQSNSMADLLALRIVYCVSSIFVLAFVTLFVYFQIRPLRSSNLLWNYDNLQLFYRHILGLARALILYFDKISIIILTASLAIEIYIQQMPGPYMNPKSNIFSKCAGILMILAHVSLMAEQAFGNKELGFIILSVSYSICLIYSLLSYISISQQMEEIPKCNFENSALMYNFFIDFKHRHKNTKEDLIRKISGHYLSCNSKSCVFLEIIDKNSNKITNEDLEQKISKYLKSFRYQTPESEIMYELWKIQLNKTITLSHKLRQFQLNHKFIIQYVLGPQNNQSKNSSNAQILNGNLSLVNDSLTFKWRFYKQLNLALDQFQRMGQIMSKSLPQLNQIIGVVVGVHQQTESLNKLFAEMVRDKQINYVCIQLYLKFVSCFMDEGKLSTDVLDRLKKLKILTDSDSIQQNPLPCFLIQAYTQTVQKINAQGLKFLKAHKYQIKDKSFTNLIAPTFTPKQLFDFQDQNSKQQFIPIFFKIKAFNNLNMLCRNIKMKSVQINNKNYFYVTVHKRNFTNNIIQILIGDSGNIVASSMHSFNLAFRHGKEEKNIEEVFSEYIKPLLDGITTTKIGRIEFGHNCLMTGLLIQKYCPYPKTRLIALNLIKKVNPNRNAKRITNIRLSRLYNNFSQLSFNYFEDENQNLILEGSQYRRSHHYSPLNDTTELKSFNQKVQLVLGKISTGQDINYSAGIKVYRLFKGDLYNIDLQDKQKYEEQFDGLHISGSNCCWKFKLNMNCLIACIVLVALLISACSLFLYISVDKNVNSIKVYQTKLLKIEQFSLNFNRIMSCLRDVANGMYEEYNRDYQAPIKNSYNQLQKIDASQFLTQQTYIGQYDGQKYQGTLSELIQVCLTHVYQFLQIEDLQIIENIHNFAIIQLGPKLVIEKEKKVQAIEETTKTIFRDSIMCFILIASGSLLYFILFLIICQKYKKNMDSYLQPLLITSQSQIRRISEQCEKFKNIIASLYKNYEVDLESITCKKQVSTRRTKPKRTNFGFSSIIAQFLIGGLITTSLIAISFIQNNKISSQITKINQAFMEGEAVIAVYSDMSWLANQIEHTGKIDKQKVIAISNKLSIIQNSKDNFQFSESIVSDVITIFFNDSCSFLVSKQIITPEWCGKSMNGFSLPNPFGLGLDLYFRRMNYNLIANITDTFASTGIFSDPFKQLFKYLSEQMRQQSDQNIVKSRSTLIALSTIVSIISFSLLGMIIVSLIYFNQKILTINNGLVVLSSQKTSNQENSENNQAIQKQQKNDGSNESQYLLMQDSVDHVRQNQ